MNVWGIIVPNVGWLVTKSLVVLIARICVFRWFNIVSPFGLHLPWAPLWLSLENRDDSDSGMSSEGPAQSRTEVNSNSFHGVESAQLQLVPHLQSLDFANHVSLPHGLPSDFGLHDTRVVAPFPRQMHESTMDTLNTSGSASGWSASEKGKAPLIDTYMPAQAPNPHPFLPADFHPASFYGSTPLFMNFTITNIQEVLNILRYILSV